MAKGALRRWWHSLDEGAWIFAKRVPGERIVWLSVPFLITGALLAGAELWTPAIALFAIAFAVFVVASAVVSRNAARAYEDRQYARRAFKFEVVLSLVWVATLVLMGIVLIVVVVIEAFSGG